MTVKRVATIGALAVVGALVTLVRVVRGSQTAMSRWTGYDE